MRDVDDCRTIAGVAQELANVGKTEGFDVFVQAGKHVFKNKFKPLNAHITKFPNESKYIWTQDNLTFTPKNELLALRDSFLETFNETISSLTGKNLQNRNYHLAGGNYFIVKDGRKNSLIIGRQSWKLYEPKTLRKDFNVKEIYPISQPDFHIDLGIRPLKNKIVLVNDKDLTINCIRNAIKQAENHLKTKSDALICGVKQNLEYILAEFKHACKENPNYKNFKRIQNELTDYGFKVVKVPGSVIRTPRNFDKHTESHYMANFMNAIVHEKPDGSLVYITNKSNLDDIAAIGNYEEKILNFSFEKMFRDSIKDYIMPENIHFISGDNLIPRLLDFSQGGVHCLCAEVPV